LRQTIHQFVPKAQTAAPLLQIRQVKGRPLPHDDRKDIIKVPVASGLELEQDEIFRAADPEPVAGNRLEATPNQDSLVVGIARKEQINRNGATSKAQYGISQERVLIGPQRIDDKTLATEHVQKSCPTGFVQERQAINILCRSTRPPDPHSQRADDTIAGAGLLQAGEKSSKSSREWVIPNCRHDIGNVSALDSGNAAGFLRCGRDSDRRVLRGFETKPMDNALSR